MLNEKRKKLPSQDYLQRFLDYNPGTGEFKWLISPRRNVVAGCVAGYVDATGYRRITIGGDRYFAHRLAFVWMIGTCPLLIDHKNKNPEDNSWDNLREATRSQNNGNCRKRNNNSSGFKGVNWHRAVGKWQARIKRNGKERHLGYFDTAEKASQAYKDAASFQWGNFANQSDD